MRLVNRAMLCEPFPRGCLPCGLAIVGDVLTLMVDQPYRSAPQAARRSSRRLQPLANMRHSARLPLYLPAGGVRSTPPIIVVPWRSQTRHSHLVGLRSVINTSNTASTASQLCTIKIRTGLDPSVRLPESPVS